MRPSPRRTLVAIAAVAGLLAACTATKLAYNNLDWIVSWQLERHVNLDPPQKALFDEGFREFWTWHRKTQLRLYARDLRELGDAAQQPLSRARVSDYLVKTGEHAMRALREATPDAARVLASMDDRQVQAMLARLAERRHEKTEEVADMDDDEVMEQAEEQMLKNLKRWVGSLDRAQKARVAAWARERRYAGTLWLQYQADWAALFTALLAHRHEPTFAARLEQLFREPRVPHRQMMAEMQAHNRKAWVALLSDLSASLSADQRAELQKRVRELADDFDVLAGQPLG